MWTNVLGGGKPAAKRGRAASRNRHLRIGSRALAASLAASLAACGCGDSDSQTTLTLRWPAATPGDAAPPPPENPTICYEIARQGRSGPGSRLAEAPAPSECYQDGTPCKVGSPIALRFPDEVGFQLRVLVKTDATAQCAGIGAWEADYFYLLQAKLNQGDGYEFAGARLTAVPGGRVEELPLPPGQSVAPDEVMLRWPAEAAERLQVALTPDFTCSDGDQSRPCEIREREPVEPAKLCLVASETPETPETEDCKQAPPANYTVYARFWNEAGIASKRQQLTVDRVPPSVGTAPEDTWFAPDLVKPGVEIAAGFRASELLQSCPGELEASGLGPALQLEMKLCAPSAKRQALDCEDTTCCHYCGQVEETGLGGPAAEGPVHLSIDAMVLDTSGNPGRIQATLAPPGDKGSQLPVLTVDPVAPQARLECELPPGVQDGQVVVFNLQLSEPLGGDGLSVNFGGQELPLCTCGPEAVQPCDCTPPSSSAPAEALAGGQLRPCDVLPEPSTPTNQCWALGGAGTRYQCSVQASAGAQDWAVKIALLGEDAAGNPIGTGEETELGPVVVVPSATWAELSRVPNLEELLGLESAQSGDVYFSDFPLNLDDDLGENSKLQQPALAVEAKLAVNLSHEPKQQPELLVRRTLGQCPEPELIPQQSQVQVPSFTLECGGRGSCKADNGSQSDRQLRFGLAQGGFDDVESGTYCLYLQWPAASGAAAGSAAFTQRLGPRLIFEKGEAPAIVRNPHLTRRECAYPGGPGGCDIRRLEGDLTTPALRPSLEPIAIQVFNGLNNSWPLATQALSPQSGEFDLDLLDKPFDPLNLYVRHVTRSGAVSERVRAATGVWTASMDGERHVARRWGSVEPGLEPYGGSEVPPEDLDRLVSDEVFELHARLSWSQLQPLQAPGPRAGAAMAYDPRRGKVVLVGGGTVRDPNRPPFSSSSPQVYPETWFWEGAHWNPLRAEDAASGGRIAALLAYDNRHSNLLSIGGKNDLGQETKSGCQGLVSSGLATLRLAAGWQKLGGSSAASKNDPGPSAAPQLIGAGAAAYDPVRGTTVLFGRDLSDDGCPAPSIWELTTSHTWQKQASACEGACPPAPSGPQIAYSEALEGLVYLADASVSASADSAIVPGDTWLLKQGEPWQRLLEGRALPSATDPIRSHHTLLQTPLGLLAVGGRCLALEVDELCFPLVLRCSSEGLSECEWEVLTTVADGQDGYPGSWEQEIEDEGDCDDRSEMCGHPRRLFAYDAARNQVVHFRTDSHADSSTWLLDLSTSPPNWVRAANEAPPTRPQATPDNGILACYDTGSTLPDDQQPKVCCVAEERLLGTPCFQRHSHGRVANLARDSELIFSGQGGDPTGNDSHEWIAGVWVERTAIGEAPQPEERLFSEMYYEGAGSGSGQGLLFDCQHEPGSSCPAKDPEEEEEEEEKGPEVWRWHGPTQPALTVAIGAEGLFGEGQLARCLASGACRLGGSGSAAAASLRVVTGGAPLQVNLWAGTGWRPLEGGPSTWSLSAEELRRSLGAEKFHFQIIPSSADDEVLHVNSVQLELQYGVDDPAPSDPAPGD